MERLRRHPITIFNALTIILQSPLWPERDKLYSGALPLYDLMVKYCKLYVQAVSQERYWLALRLLAKTENYLNMAIDDINGIDTAERHSLLKVWNYYANLLADFSKIQGR